MHLHIGMRLASDPVNIKLNSIAGIDKIKPVLEIKRMLFVKEEAFLIQMTFTAALLEILLLFIVAMKQGLTDLNRQ